MTQKLKNIDIEKIKRRKGAMKRSDIQPEVLDALHHGLVDTITLAEWLAIDMKKLLKNILPNVGLENEIGSVIDRFDKIKNEGVTKRLKGVGEILYGTIKKRTDRSEIFEGLANYTSDMVRVFANYIITADSSMSLKDRHKRTRRFASDPSVAVRECAWDSFRPYIHEELTKGIELLTEWIKDENPNIRRCALESTRPRGVWTFHVPALKTPPEYVINLLEPLKSDQSRYVQNSLGNWLNDASKDHPDWVIGICKRWEKESPTKETVYIIKGALRNVKNNWIWPQMTSKKTQL